MKEIWGDAAIQKGWRFLRTVSKVGSVCTQRGTCDISTTYKCKIFPCFFPSLSVWAVTTCWSLLSRKTPACSVGVTDSPATVSRTASLCATCQLVRLQTHSQMFSTITFFIISFSICHWGTRKRNVRGVGFFSLSLQHFVTTGFMSHLCFRLQPDVHHPCWSHHHQHQRNGGHTQLPRWLFEKTNKPKILYSLYMILCSVFFDCILYIQWLWPLCMASNQEPAWWVLPKWPLGNWVFQFDTNCWNHAVLPAGSGGWQCPWNHYRPWSDYWTPCCWGKNGHIWDNFCLACFYFFLRL